jgi:hypothetical protein
VDSSSGTLSVIVSVDQLPGCPAGGSGLSRDAVIGIAVGCAVVGVIAAVILVVVMLKWRDHATVLAAGRLRVDEANKLAELKV